MRNLRLRLLPLVCLLGLIGLPVVSLAQEMQAVEMEQASSKPALSSKSDTKPAVKVAFNAYVVRLNSRIRNNWHPPVHRSKQPLRIVAKFRVDRAGLLSDLTLTEPAQDLAQNQAALEAVQISAPFEVLPEAYDGKDITVEFIFEQERKPYKAGLRFEVGPSPFSRTIFPGTPASIFNSRL